MMKLARALGATVTLGLFVAACQAPGGSWGTAVVKETDGFGDYYETVVNVPLPTGAPRAFSCVGPWSATTSDTYLKGIFGVSRVVQAPDVLQPSGATGPGSIVLPEDPKLRVAVAWADGFAYAGPLRFNFSEETAWSVNGVGIGTTLAQLEKINGKPFRLVGFGGDNGGLVTDWQGGTLSNLQGGCALTVQLAISALAPASAQAKVVGPRVFSSSDRNVRTLRPTVGSFWVYYAR
ncbi:hypothetical protein GCM10007301_53340 [Azorhizobium oxalatiphilum]|uniref:Lipoprotein n=1 Tax=Azorhizobium oxalatiphilum TaxID=980631 RepID=A0A917CID3_9HYPH|nr:hypothetical protein [Azorhizobium oxalatiphilum]GGF86762.1 hypothetical protein GCM10007301_53340 [Azorhizobium oxalatiphilum]